MGAAMTTCVALEPDAHWTGERAAAAAGAVRRTAALRCAAALRCTAAGAVRRTAALRCTAALRGAPPGWQPPYPHYGYPPPPNTNGFAIASLCCSLGGFVIWFVGPLLGITFGVIAMRSTGVGKQGGRGLAIAGIVVGGLLLLLNIAFLVAFVHSWNTGGADNGGFST